MFGNGKIKMAGTPIPRSERPDEQTVIERPTTKNFADYLDCGSNPRDVMDKLPAALENLTPKRLEKCLAAGLLLREIADKFSTTFAVVDRLCTKYGLRKSKMKADTLKEPEPKAADQAPAQSTIEVIQATTEALEEFFAEDVSVPGDDPVDEQVVQEILEHLPTIKDSGQRTEFPTGAVRDMQEGKGRMDLAPWGAIMELSKHCEAGAIKYGERNIDKGLPISCLLNSALRHLAKYLMGFKDEDHLLAAFWNLAWAVQFVKYKPEMQDIPSRIAS